MFWQSTVCKGERGIKRAARCANLFHVPLDKLLCGYPANFLPFSFPSFLPILFSFCFGYNSKSLEGYLDATSRIYILFMVSSKAFIFYRLFFHLQEPVISADEIIFLALQLLPAGGQKGADRKIRPISV